MKIKLSVVLIIVCLCCNGLFAQVQEYDNETCDTITIDSSADVKVNYLNSSGYNKIITYKNSGISKQEYTSNNALVAVVNYSDKGKIFDICYTPNNKKEFGYINSVEFKFDDNDNIVQELYGDYKITLVEDEFGDLNMELHTFQYFKFNVLPDGMRIGLSK